MQGFSNAQILEAQEDLFAARLKPGELDFKGLECLAKPFTGKALVGLPFGHEEACVTPEGAVLAPIDRRKLWLRFETESGEGLFDVKSRSLLGGEPIVRHRRNGWRQEVRMLDDGHGGGILEIRLIRPEREGRPWLSLAVLDRGPNIWQDPEQKPKAATPPILDEYGISFGDGYLAGVSPGFALAQTKLPTKSWIQQRVALAESPDRTWTLRVPLVARLIGDQKGPPAPKWKDLLKPLAKATFPDPRLNGLVEKLIPQLLVTAEGDFMPYGAFPSAYDNAFFGPEEGWCIQALAEWGLKDVAERLFRGTFLTKEYADKNDRHHQYRNGLLAKYAADLHAILNDDGFLHEMLPHINRTAQTTLETLAQDEMGLMPHFNYGGDLTVKARALWPNACAWRGLRDAGDLLKEPRFLREAAKYRTRIRMAFREAKGHTKTFYPLSLEETEATQPSPEYYQLFAPLILETGIFNPDEPEFKEIERYMKATGRIQAGVPRFSPDKVAAIDAEYIYGYQLMNLRRGDRNGFLTGVLGQIGLSLDPVYGTSPEVTPLLLDDAAMKKQQAEQEENWGRSTEPCSAGVGVTLLYLRRMLVWESANDEDTPTGSLQIFPAVPDSWWRASRPWGVKGLPTRYGTLDLTVTPGAKETLVEAALPGLKNDDGPFVGFVGPKGSKGAVDVGKHPGSEVSTFRGIKPSWGRVRVRLTWPDQDKGGS